MKKNKLKIGIYGISGCAGCLLSFVFEKEFTKILELIDLKAFPLIKEDYYKGEFDYCFIEGTVVFDKDIIKINELRKRSRYIIALGACAHLGGVPTMKNFLDSHATMKLVYPSYNHLKPTIPTPISDHIKVDFYLPQCPPNKEEIIEFVKTIVNGRKFKNYDNPVCLECRKKANPCILEQGKICLGPITNGGCGALCPTNNTECYGCRGPNKDANIKAFLEMLNSRGYTSKEVHDKMKTFAGMQFRDLEEEEDNSTWLEK